MVSWIEVVNAAEGFFRRRAARQLFKRPAYERQRQDYQRAAVASIFIWLSSARCSLFIGAIPRPVTPKYPQVSLVLQSEISSAITSGDVKAALQTAKDKIQAIVKA